MSQDHGGDSFPSETDTSAIAPRVDVERIPFLAHLGQNVWASINPANKQQVVRVMNVIQQDHALLSDLIGEKIRVVHVVVHPAQSNLEGAVAGETYRRIVLRLLDGLTVTCGAKGVFQSLYMMTAAFGPPPWKDGVEVVCRQKSVGKSSRWLFLELVEPTDADSAGEVPL